MLAAAAAIVLAIAMPCNAHAQKGEKTFGVQTGYISKNESAIAGLFFQYGLTDHLRIAPEMGCVLRHKDLDAFTMDLNLHVPVLLNTETIQIYPLAGLNYSSWARHNIPTQDGDDVSSRKSKFGANLGAGFQIMASPALKLKLEAKYTLISHYSSCVISAGIGYVF